MRQEKFDNVTIGLRSLLLFVLSAGFPVLLSFPQAALAAVTFTPTANPAGFGQFFNVFDFGTQSIGTPASDRIVVVGIASNATENLSSVTIGGTPATEAANPGDFTTSSWTSLWYAPIPTGTTADITLTYSSGGIGLIIIMVGTLNGANLTPYDSESSTVDGCGSPSSVTATVPTNGTGVAIGLFGPSDPIDWTGSTNDPNGDYYTTDSDLNGLSASLAHTNTSGSDTMSFPTPGCDDDGESLTTWGPGTPANTLYIDGSPQEGQASNASTISNTTGLTTANAGDIILTWVHAEWTAGSTNGVVSGISDTAGLTWHKRASTAFTDSSVPTYNDLELWWAYAPSALSGDTITPTFTTPGGNDFDAATIMVSAVTGFSGTYYGTNPWDSNSSLPAINNSIAASTIPSVSGVSTASADDMLVGFAANSQNGQFLDPGSGFTMLGTVNGTGGSQFSESAGEFQDVFSTQSSITVPFGDTVANTTGMIVDALSQSPVAPGVTGRVIRLTGGIRLIGGVLLE